MILNGDATATNNINADGATIAANTAGSGHFLIGFDGLLHLPLVDNTGMANNHNAAGQRRYVQRNPGQSWASTACARRNWPISPTSNTFIKALAIDRLPHAGQVRPQRHHPSTGQLGAVEGIPGHRVGADAPGRRRRQGDQRRRQQHQGPPAHRQPLPVARRLQARADTSKRCATPRSARTSMVVSFRIAVAGTQRQPRQRHPHGPAIQHHRGLVRRKDANAPSP